MVMAASESNSKRRVKLYMLNDERLWDDRGTGHVTSVYNGRLQGMVLIVRAETDGTLLLESKINLDTAYQKQQETLIVWSEADNYDLALSFQEKIGCDEIWEKICQVQGKDPSVHLTQDVVEESEDERFDELPDTAPPIELPPCELSKLLKISELFNSVLQSPVQKEKLSIPLESDGYIKKLLELFHMCEDLENMEGLHHLYDIFKAIFLLNKNALFEIMFADDTIFDVVGVLEYDPSLPQPARHREFLRTKASFKEVIPLSNTELVQKIHQTYRVQYIQDVILPTPSVFEENILSTLSSFIFFNKVEIVTLLQDDEAFLLSLFKQLVDEDTEDERRRDLVLFLKEFCTFSQTLQVPNRDPFFKVLSNMGVLSAIEALLQFDDDVIKAAAIDVLSYIVEYSPSMVREYIKQESQKQDDEELLINLVIDQMISDNDPELGGSVQLMGILRLLIDPDNMIPTANFALQKTEKTDFLVFFYKHSMHTLTARLFAVTATDKLSKDDYRTAHLLSLIIELLTFCIEHHNYHIKNYVINKDLIRRVLVLLKSKHAFLALSAIRLFRRTVGLKEEFYNKYLVKGSLFQPIVDCFIRNGIKYNLLNSAIIELFEFIKTEDIRSLILHIVENHATAFEDVTYVNTFKELTKRFEQHQERIKERPLDGSMSLLRDARYRRDPRSMEEEEEMYFDQDDELDDETVTADLLTRSHTRLEPFNFIEASRERYSIDEDIEDAPRRLPPRQGISININKNLAEVNGNSPPPNGGQAPATSPVTDSPTSTPDADTPHTSPTTNHVSPTPTTTPFSSPTISASGGATLDTPPTDDQSQKKVPFVGLVDYPDEDSEEEESDDGGVSPTKRARVSST